MQPILLAVTRAATVSLLLGLTGCATLTGSSTQTLTVSTVDAKDRPVRGMTCTISYTAGTYVFDTPVTDLEVRRSASDMQIECRRGSQIAKATVISRGESAMAHSFIPGGSVATMIDYATGAMYTYPSPLKLKIGQHLKFESGGEAKSTVMATVGSEPTVKAGEQRTLKNSTSSASTQ